MSSKRRCIVFLAVLSFVCLEGFCENSEDNWNDFLHYTAIGRFDLARGYGEKLVASEPEPVELLALSENNPKGYKLLLKIFADNEELKEVSSQILDIIEQGRFVRRIDPRIITEEIKRLSSTIRGRLTAQKRLANAGEYAIPYMLGALGDESRKDEFANITNSLSVIGRQAIRPLSAALEMDNVAVKAEAIMALGEIGYRQAGGYLKYIVEQDPSEQLRELAGKSIENIDPSISKLPASELFFESAENYYYHTESLAPSSEYDFGNIWFWDKDSRRVVRKEVSKEYFNELMSMRLCEYALRADPDMGKAIALWIAGFFKAESTGLAMPEYFGASHADAMTYATTAGAEYLHQALERAIADKNEYVALGVVEALAANAGESSLLYRIGTEQPLVSALSFDDRAVRYSAAIAIGSAGPTVEFLGSNMIVENLAQAVAGEGSDELGDELSDAYSLRAVNVMLELAISRNRVVELIDGRDALIKATKSAREQMQALAGNVLARLNDTKAQQGILEMALSPDNSSYVKLAAFSSLAVSAKQNGNLLSEEQIDKIYSLITSDTADVDMRSGAAMVYGSLNLPSKRVKDLILDQAKN